MVRRGNLPRVVFEVVSPSELRAWRARTRKRRDLQDGEGVEEILELYQAEAAAHIYRRRDGGTWTFEAVDGPDGVLMLRSVGVELPLEEVYRLVYLPGEARDAVG